MTLLKVLELPGETQDIWRHVWIAELLCLLFFISCKKMSYNLFLLAFVLGITGAFHYGLQVSIINSPAEVSMESSKSELQGFHCSLAFMPLYAMASFLLVLSKLGFLALRVAATALVFYEV